MKKRYDDNTKTFSMENFTTALTMNNYNSKDQGE